MAQFIFITEVQCTKVFTYAIEADTMEEAEQTLMFGEVRGEGTEVEEDIEWGSEIIVNSELI